MEPDATVKMIATLTLATDDLIPKNQFWLGLDAYVNDMFTKIKFVGVILILMVFCFNPDGSVLPLATSAWTKMKDMLTFGGIG